MNVDQTTNYICSNNNNNSNNNSYEIGNLFNQYKLTPELYFNESSKVLDYVINNKSNEKKLQYIILIYQTYHSLYRYDKDHLTSVEHLLQSIKDTPTWNSLHNYIINSPLTLNIQKHGDYHSLFKYIPSFESLIMNNNNYNCYNNNNNKSPTISNLLLQYILEILFKDKTLSSQWKVSLGSVCKQFHMVCSNILSNHPIPMDIYSGISIGSQFCLYKSPPLYLCSTEIQYIPSQFKRQCLNNLLLFTLVFLETAEMLPADYSEITNLKHIRFQDYHQHSYNNYEPNTTTNQPTYNIELLYQLVFSNKSLVSFDFITVSPSLQSHYTIGLQFIQSIIGNNKLKANTIQFIYNNDSILDNVEMSDLACVTNATLFVENSFSDGSALFKFGSSRKLTVFLKAASQYNLHMPFHLGQFIEHYSLFEELTLVLPKVSYLAVLLRRVTTKFKTLNLEIEESPMDSLFYSDNNYDKLVSSINGVFGYLEDVKFQSIRSLSIKHRHFTLENKNRRQHSFINSALIKQEYLDNKQIQTRSFKSKDPINFYR
ncbi:hypothetical protein PPL_02400 [Heterostelium album PN500]|uniref:Uncharacterized protein n=1 Tax=Heterostelium pallidum (strain ATCC 26659 / Pp 5 / PN500) TaxID=670386 RepID=D3AZL8_HETP5|nr:hypothetical protein PPL_02400 [Heterostelium album PN500]EFA85397.1 hypothetical protein PPL_02400 [Heterostelium album PN500]|eukprot:XP_020437506.1 hypothetical protein PPL_02400 [Heterostelium album PN500]